MYARREGEMKGLSAAKSAWAKQREDGTCGTGAEIKTSAARSKSKRWLRVASNNASKNIIPFSVPPGSVRLPLHKRELVPSDIQNQFNCLMSCRPKSILRPTTRAPRGERGQAYTRVWPHHCYSSRHIPDNRYKSALPAAALAESLPANPREPFLFIVLHSPRSTDQKTASI